VPKPFQIRLDKARLTFISQMQLRLAPKYYNAISHMVEEKRRIFQTFRRLYRVNLTTYITIRNVPGQNWVTDFTELRQSARNFIFAKCQNVERIVTGRKCRVPAGDHSAAQVARNSMLT
jgi:hypothetical protein